MTTHPNENQNSSLNELRLIRTELMELRVELRKRQIDIVDQVAKGVAIALLFWMIVNAALQAVVSRI